MPSGSQMVIATIDTARASIYQTNITLPHEQKPLKGQMVILQATARWNPLLPQTFYPGNLSKSFRGVWARAVLVRSFEIETSRDVLCV